MFKSLNLQDYIKTLRCSCLIDLSIARIIYSEKVGNFLKVHTSYRNDRSDSTRVLSIFLRKYIFYRNVEQQFFQQQLFGTNQKYPSLRPEVVSHNRTVGTKTVN